ncbi:hypothetical protein Back11_25180 [Paenibacillus baekrokdamisoli]|uniref:Uncharacterized protein n=1 Tax=Paenibacillus baekrokdamisoli TaxID=1712516 RepID=A0A3G9J8I4_9BACL|nr:hypothetical protein [Paenibacillus baekrokdamisoli]BBH21173.1 hypothetical protein Back11_25180 [Paenibacillus baekrokdamisoli]
MASMADFTVGMNFMVGMADFMAVAEVSTVEMADLTVVAEVSTVGMADFMVVADISTVEVADFMAVGIDPSRPMPLRISLNAASN